MPQKLINKLSLFFWILLSLVFVLGQFFGFIVFVPKAQAAPWGNIDNFDINPKILENGQAATLQYNLRISASQASLASVCSTSDPKISWAITFSPPISGLQNTIPGGDIPFSNFNATNQTAYLSNGTTASFIPNISCGQQTENFHVVITCNVPGGNPSVKEISQSADVPVTLKNSSNPNCGSGSGSGSGTQYASSTDQLYNPLPTGALITMFLIITRAFLLGIGAIGVLFIIIGGFQYVIAAGNEEAIVKARKTITWAIIGVVIASLSFAIVAIVQNLLAANVKVVQ